VREKRGKGREGECVCDREVRVVWHDIGIYEFKLFSFKNFLLEIEKKYHKIEHKEDFS